jgi:two-component system, OmpR family, sensor histidine kinase CreC
VRGAVELLQEPLPPAEQQRFLTNIARENQRMHQLVEKLLGLAALQSRRSLETADKIQLDVLMSEAAAVLEGTAAARKIKVQVYCPAGATLHGNRFWLQEALVNLLQNALEFSAAGQTVTLSGVCSEAEACIIVTDEGPGLPEWARDKVFDQFFSLPRPDTNKKSSGLGLSIVKEVAELHGGSIDLSNRTPKGLEARLILPLKS